MHVVDKRKRSYFGKSDYHRSVVAKHEYMTDQEADVSKPLKFILPRMTQPCDLHKFASFHPVWNEVFSLLKWLFVCSSCRSVVFVLQDVIVMEELKHLLTPYTLLLFEVLDFGPKVDLTRFPDGFYLLTWRPLPLSVSVVLRLPPLLLLGGGCCTLPRTCSSTTTQASKSCP